jgi:hypothetical protein
MPNYGMTEHEMIRFTGNDERYHTLEMEGSLDSWDPARDKRNENSLRQRLQYIRDKGVRLVLIALPAKRTNLYAMIKQTADVHVGIHTVCAVAGWQNHEKGRSGASNTPLNFLGIYWSNTI